MTETEPGKNLVVVVGIAGIVILECVAMAQGMNGQLLATALGTIALIVGYAFGHQTAKGQ